MVQYGQQPTYTGNFYDDYRQVAIENLYWLTGKDCDIDEWKKHIDLLEKWHITSDENDNFIYSSMFHNEEEKEKDKKDFEFLYSFNPENLFKK